MIPGGSGTPSHPHNHTNNAWDLLGFLQNSLLSHGPWDIFFYICLQADIKEDVTSFNWCMDALQRRSVLYIPRKETVTEIPHSCICEGFILLYIPTNGPPIFCSKIGGPNLGIYKPLTDTWMWKLGMRSPSLFSGNICLEFSVQCLCSVYVLVDVKNILSQVFIFIYSFIFTYCDK